MSASGEQREECSTQQSLAVAELLRGVSRALPHVFHGQLNCWVHSAPPSAEDFLLGGYHRAASWSDLSIQCQDVSGSYCPDVAVGAHLALEETPVGLCESQPPEGSSQLSCCHLPCPSSQSPGSPAAWSVMGSHRFSTRVPRYSWCWFGLLFPAQPGSLAGSFGKDLWKIIHFHISCVLKSMLGKY